MEGQGVDTSLLQPNNMLPGVEEEIDEGYDQTDFDRESEGDDDGDDDGDYREKLNILYYKWSIFLITSKKKLHMLIKKIN